MIHKIYFIHLLVLFNISNKFKLTEYEIQPLQKYLTPRGYS